MATRLISPQGWVRWAVGYAKEKSLAAMVDSDASANVERMPQKDPSESQSLQVALSSSRQRQSPAQNRIATYLLLAAFLASFNPARLDARYFLRDEHALLPAAERDITRAKLRRKKGGAFRKRPKKKAAADEGRKEALVSTPCVVGRFPRPRAERPASVRALACRILKLFSGRNPSRSSVYWPSCKRFSSSRGRRV